MSLFSNNMIEIYFLIFIAIIWILIKKAMRPKWSFALDLGCSFIVFGTIVYISSKYSLFNNLLVLEYIYTIRKIIEVMLLFILLLFLFYATIGFFGKRYSLRIDNFNIGGINVFFDKSSEIYIKTVGTFIASKRTLFNFNEKKDNISEVLDAYYETYKYIKDNLELLDFERDKELYELSIEILHKLNHFLTHHQNDYRRWYNHIINEDRIKLPDFKNIIVHETTIELVQKNYYRYDELLEEISIINDYFSNNIKEKFKIKYFDWSEKTNA